MRCGDVGLCDRCGCELDRINVTAMWDPEPRYLYEPCTCPGPRCPFCGWRLDDTGVTRSDECHNPACFMFGVWVPIPEVA